MENRSIGTQMRTARRHCGSHGDERGLIERCADRQACGLVLAGPDYAAEVMGADMGYNPRERYWAEK